MNIFLFENYNIQLDKEEILLVREFAEIYSLKWNQGEPGDKDGRKRLRAFKLFTYVYLVHDWKSPYSEFTAKEKHEAALEDSQIDPAILKEPEVVAVINKYTELQDTRITKLLKAAYRGADELQLYFTLVDLQERDLETGKPIFTAKDLMSNLGSLAKTVESLQELEVMVKKEKDGEKSLRGQAEAGLFD